MVYELYYHSNHGQFDSKRNSKRLLTLYTRAWVAPREGWLRHTRLYLLNLLFPHLDGPHDPDKFKAVEISCYSSCMAMCGSMKGRNSSIAMTSTFSSDEVQARVFDEYLRFNKLVRAIMSTNSRDLIPISHLLTHRSYGRLLRYYVRQEQLYDAGSNVDLGLLSAMQPLTILSHMAAWKRRAYVFPSSLLCRLLPD